MLIKAFGLFWQVDEIDWTPGSGNANVFRLLGRVGANLPGVRVCDFRQQRGIYILYGNYGAYYVGLTRDQDLGSRLKQHLSDEHGGNWQRFSWFGFRSVLGGSESDGTQRLKVLGQLAIGSVTAAIGDIEALLIKAIGPRNKQNMSFAKAEEWTQILRDQAEMYLARVASK